jgi:type IV pilus assembly protein PilX
MAATFNHPRSRRRLNSPYAPQRGVTLVIALIALVVLTVGAIALTRSTNTSLRMAGNLAFKRDLANQGERAIAAALAELRTGALSATASRSANRNASNYSATWLPSSAEGIPNVLANDTTFASSGFSRPDIDDTAAAIKVRYVIDRQCTAAGGYSEATCQSQSNGGVVNAGGSGGADLRAPPVRRPVYRISVRVTGPRGVQTFTQTTLTL